MADLATELLQTFSNKEKKSFIAWLRDGSKKGEQLARLATQIGKANLIPDNKELFKLIFPDQKYDGQKINQYLSHLNRTGQKFLLNHLEHSYQPIALVRELHRRGLVKHRDRLIKKTYSKTKLKMMSYREQYEWERLIFDLRYQNNREAKHNLAFIDHLLDLDFFLSKLRQACSLRSHEALGSEKFDYSLLESLTPRINALPLNDHPVIAAFLHAYQFLSDPNNEGAWVSFQKILVSKGDFFGEEDAKNLYLLAINYCIRRANQGITGMAKQALDLYESGIEKGTLLDGEYLSSFSYRNVVALGIYLRKYKWVERFIYQQEGYITRFI
ncbi:MAG: hypothetical protein AAF741_06680 [Bacteroidota bacterium]